MAPNDSDAATVGPSLVGEYFADRYAVMRYLGAGGTGSVYQVRDRLAGEIIALKLFQPAEAQTAKLVDNFRRELTVARRLSHPNVIRIFDIGEHRGQLFILMEYVEGRTLASVLAERGRFPYPEFLTVFRQFCDALGYIHSSGFIHRDVKPQNVIIDPKGALKLMDFGMAREVGGPQTVGVIHGTPAYMSPEQIAGQALTMSSDIYSAGCMFFELLTGRRPFGNISLAQRVEAPPPALDAQALGVPPELAAAIRRSMEPEPAHRFASIAELLAAARGNAQAAPRPASGRGISNYLSDGPAEPGAVVPVFRKIAAKLREVQQAGLRPEITPPNIAFQGDQIVFPNAAISAPDRTVSIQNAKYSAPEAFTDAGNTTPAARTLTDIYSLGFVFYEILLGRRAFQTEFQNVISAGSDLEWLRWHGDLTKSARPPAAVHSAVPKALSDAVQKMIAKKPSDRFQDLGKVIEALERIDTKLGKTVLIRTIPPVEAAPRRSWIPTNPLMLTVMGAGLVVALFFLVYLATLLFGKKTLVEWMAEQFGSGPPSKTEPRKDTSNGAKPAVAETTPAKIETPTGVMVFIPEGDLDMGRDTPAGSPEENEGPRHKVHVGPFYIDRTEATNAAYRKFCDETHRKYPPNPEWDPRYFDQGDLPVIQVSWQDAHDFAAWAGKRLPSEAEWERAARGDDGRLYPWGDSHALGSANLRGSSEDGYRFAAPVGAMTFDESPFGVRDLSGNVLEWVADEYHAYPGRASATPAGWRVVRGGGFLSDLSEATATHRLGRKPEFDSSDPSPVGFRCVADVPQALRLRGVSSR